MTWSWMFTVFFTRISKTAGTKCFLNQLNIQRDGAGSSFEERVGAKTLGDVTTENGCYERDAPLRERLPVQVWTVTAHLCTGMHCSQSWWSWFTTWCCPLPRARPSLRAKSAPHLRQNLWKPVWPEVPGSVRRDTPPSHKAHGGGLDSLDKLIVRRTHFCSKSWLVPRANLRRASEQLISWQKMWFPVWEEEERANFNRADPFSSLKGLLLLWKPEPKPNTAQKEMGAERTCPSVLKG